MTNDSALQTVDVSAVRSALGFSEEEMDEFAEYYNTRFDEYDNEIYASLKTRLVHWANFLQDRWFDQRIHAYLDAASDFDVVVDVGFSVPYPYTRRDLVDNEDTRYIFVDGEASAIEFYRALLPLAGSPRRAALDRVLLADIECAEDQQRMEQALRECRPETALIVASEVLEHLDDPERGWAALRRLQQVPTNNGVVYVTLPIGERIPSHHMEFPSAEDARRYIHRHMEVSSDVLLEAPPDFAGRPFLNACLCVLGRVRD